ncbi:MAG: cobalt ECF transporter T component CbiQ [Oscillospiraceae bacterium]|nr:cobalt ECF transporter T component CbiQ [Oscillospiraceae bacterium]
MITAVLAFVFVWSLFYEQIPQPFLLMLCVGLGIFLAFTSRHKHSQFLSNDVLAQASPLRKVNPTLKFWTLLALMIINVASRNPYTGLFLMLVMFIFAVFAGRVSVHNYVQVIVLPVLFLLIGGLALLFEVSYGPTGVLNFNIFGLWLSVSEKAQLQTALVISRAFGAVSCLCVLSITTPMPDIIGVLRRARCPDFIIDLMYLIYRYIFILLTIHHEMYNAAKSRLGFRDHRTSLRATGRIYANLLARSYQFADKNFDAMESRCYDSGVNFLEHRGKITFVHGCYSVILISVSLCLGLLPL